MPHIIPLTWLSWYIHCIKRMQSRSRSTKFDIDLPSINSLVLANDLKQQFPPPPYSTISKCWPLNSTRPTIFAFVSLPKRLFKKIRYLIQECRLSLFVYTFKNFRKISGTWLFSSSIKNEILSKMSPTLSHFLPKSRTYRRVLAVANSFSDPFEGLHIDNIGKFALAISYLASSISWKFFGITCLVFNNATFW